MLILTTINVTFAVFLYAFIIATKEKEERQTDEIQLQPRRVWRTETSQFLVRSWLTEERKQQSGKFFQSRRHPSEAPGSSSISKLYEVNITALR